MSSYADAVKILLTVNVSLILFMVHFYFGFLHTIKTLADGVETCSFSSYYVVVNKA